LSPAPKSNRHVEPAPRSDRSDHVEALSSLTRKSSLCRWQKELYKALEIEKRPVQPPALNEEMIGEIERTIGAITGRLDTTGQENVPLRAVDGVEEEVVESYPEDQPEQRLMARNVRPPERKIFRDDILITRRSGWPALFRNSRNDCEVGCCRELTVRRCSPAVKRRLWLPDALALKKRAVMDDSKGRVKASSCCTQIPAYSVGEVGRLGLLLVARSDHGALARRPRGRAA